MLFVLLLYNNVGMSQDMQFSQSYSSPLYLNPALAGKDICPKVNMGYRNQWPSMGKGFVTYSASYDQYVEKISGGLGILAFMDYAGEGTLYNASVSGMYSYKFEINRDVSAAAAIEAGYKQYGVNYSKLVFADMIDSRYGVTYNNAYTGNENINNVDFSVGTIIYSNAFYAGLASHHILQPNIGFENNDLLYRKYTFHSGYTHFIKKFNRITREQESFSVNLLLQQQKNLRNINAGIYYTKTPLVGGIWYRNNFFHTDALILLLGIEKNFITFGYSYDITLSKIANISGGSHELSLILHFDCPKKKFKVREINCPTF